jgi:hypothetical protein
VGKPFTGQIESKLQLQLADRRHMNQRLIADNHTLKYLSLVQQTQSLHNETMLARLVHSLTAERDELAHRLEISLSIKQELKSKQQTVPPLKAAESAARSKN